ncbi:MAG: hypothetical protein ACXVLQ_14855 [Bacteriovorax sp.]
MKKWLILILSFLIKPLTGRSQGIHPMEELKEFIRENALKIVVGLTLITAMGTMLTAGIVIIVTNLAAQYDLGLTPRFTATVGGGLGILVAGLLFIGLGLYFSVPHDQLRRRSRKHKETASPIEDAIALLINDFVKEREAKREAAAFHRHERMKESAYANYQSSEEFERH